MKCCYPSKFHYESIGDGNIETIQSTCPAVDSYNSQQGAASAPQVDPNSCDAHRSEGYECVPFYQCEDGEIIDDGAGLLDIRFVSGAMYIRQNFRDFTPPLSASHATYNQYQ